MSRRHATYIRQAQTLSLPCDLFLHYIQKSPGRPHCQVCGGYPDNEHTYWAVYGRPRLTGRACTDVVAQWNQGTKRNVQPGKIAEMTFHLQPATVDPEVQRQPAAANVLLSEVEIHEMHRDSGYPDLFSIPGTMSYRSCARLRGLEQFLCRLWPRARPK